MGAFLQSRNFSVSKFYNKSIIIRLKCNQLLIYVIRRHGKCCFINYCLCITYMQLNNHLNLTCQIFKTLKEFILIRGGSYLCTVIYRSYLIISVQKKNDTDKTTVNDRGAMSIIKTDISNVQL